ncbi:hypothetical protein JGI7_01293 [Candidatus Kryptonium thompsonii]|uniref:Uncharacterized protein n=1 Tax=Candidatus Kryptonium thompsonii TaxID=1633631 RepID=A0A0P1LCJ8_9BACT|nr:hypothetical protein [Candidatus Kryptonium thompsoni]CUS78878.1 hypothetical protein JGI15_100438 [Candidatus Kryptonium thompsoni]CUS80930.1 hypothetical protein JGI8_00454 [Candidatus Kryptonium thompsoni]CUS84889.1 hypothetical protein JGI12_00815 [Candidatus Kryptonium thompsoni]CUS88437.1 hypothetical protein JGI6_01286 [Candidatus Kryptonium thompsoni]CUS89221.1 hypothetical protein JGI7_01293 [Candidatus Kryptonium thompsoni]
MLLGKALEVLKKYRKGYRAQKWLVEGTRLERYTSIESVQKVFKHACNKVGIEKMLVFTLRYMQGLSGLKIIKHKKSKSNKKLVR